MRIEQTLQKVIEESKLWFFQRNKNDPKTGISLTDVPNAIYAKAFITSKDCDHRFFVNIEEILADSFTKSVIISLKV